MNLTTIRTSLLAFALLAGTILQAQTPATPPPPPPAPYQPSSYPYTGYVNTQGTTPVVADVTLPYVFNFNNVGIIGDVGGIWNNHFFGAEVSYFDAKPDHHDYFFPGSGYYGYGYRDNAYNENITTVNFAYRYYIPISNNYWGNMGVYLGGAAGAGWVDVDNFFYPGFGPNFYNHRSGTPHFDANGVAGLQWNFNRTLGLKIGYRYIWVDNSHLFYSDQRLASSALEGALSFHF